jgi:hypothetical protein
MTNQTTTQTAEIGKDFLLAGRAIFTVANPKGERYTFKVTKKDAQEGSRYTQPTYFISLLTGSDNENDYTYMGIVSNGRVVVTKASRFTVTSIPVQVAEWVIRLMLADRTVPAGYFLGHEGRCGRCGRTLTVPSSLISGLGPDCLGKMGLAAAPALPVFESADSVDRAEMALGVQ